MRITSSEFIDTFLSEESFNCVEAVGHVDKGDVILNVETGRAAEYEGHCFEIEFVVDKSVN